MSVQIFTPYKYSKEVFLCEPKRRSALYSNESEAVADFFPASKPQSRMHSRNRAADMFCPVTLAISMSISTCLIPSGKTQFFAIISISFSSIFTFINWKIRTICSGLVTDGTCVTTLNTFLNSKSFKTPIELVVPITNSLRPSCGGWRFNRTSRVCNIVFEKC